jgi:hypothetical protein
MRTVTVKELIEMINTGELLVAHSTQRKFLYADEKTTINGREVSKAGKVIHSIVEDDIQLPGIYFFHNTDTGTTHLLDGKQRALSCYYFITGEGVTVTTLIGSAKGDKEVSHIDMLGPTRKKKLLEYQFAVTEAWGDTAKEEQTFHEINGNGLPLTDYEKLCGVRYGTYLDGFEAEIEALHNSCCNVTKVRRGEQAINILYTLYNLRDGKQRSDKNAAYNTLLSILSMCRNHPFDAEACKLEPLLKFYNALVNVVKGLTLERALSVARHVVIENNYDTEKVIKMYQSVIKSENDVKKWDMDTHRIYIDTYIRKGIFLDARRYFTDTEKGILYKKHGQCSHIYDNGDRCEKTLYSDLECDHIKPWSKGGHTTIKNCQLLCREHNAQKGNR